MKYICNFGQNIELYLSGDEWVLEVEATKTTHKSLESVFSHLVEVYLKRRVDRRVSQSPVSTICLLSEIRGARDTAVMAAKALQEKFSELLGTLRDDKGT